jgi:hypothetical protein
MLAEGYGERIHCFTPPPATSNVAFIYVISKVIINKVFTSIVNIAVGKI